MTENGAPGASSTQAKIGNLQSIYAVPQGNRRAIFLKNNYTKNANLINAHQAKNQRLVEARNSRSPRALDEDLDYQEGSQKKYFNEGGKA